MVSVTYKTGSPFPGTACWGKAGDVQEKWHNTGDTRTPHHRTLTLQEGNDLAHEVSEYEVLQDGADERERHAEHAAEQVGDAEVEQVDVGDGAHLGVLDQCDDDEHVSEHAQEQDERVDANLQPPLRPDLAELGVLVRRQRATRRVRSRLQDAVVEHAGAGVDHAGASVNHVEAAAGHELSSSAPPAAAAGWCAACS